MSDRATIARLKRDNDTLTRELLKAKKADAEFKQAVWDAYEAADWHTLRDVLMKSRTSKRPTPLIFGGGHG